MPLKVENPPRHDQPLTKTTAWTEKPGKNKEKSVFVNPSLRLPETAEFFKPKLPVFLLGARLRGRTATQRSKKGSEKVLGRVLGKGFQMGSEKSFREGGQLWVLQ